MKHCRWGVLAVTIALTLPGFGEEYARSTHDKGSWRFAFGASLTANDTYDEGGTWSGETSWNALGSVEVGAFFADGWELGGRFVGSRSWTTGSSDPSGTADLQLYLKYYFVGDSNLVPYAGLQGGLSWYGSGDYAASSGSAGGMLGIEYLLSETASVYVEYNGLVTGYEGGSRVRNQILAGLVFYFD